MTCISRSCKSQPAAAQMPSSRPRTMCRASSAAYNNTRPGCGTGKCRRHGVREATATAKCRARKDLQHFGSPPTIPTASSNQRSVTSHRCASARSGRGGPVVRATPRGCPSSPAPGGLRLTRLRHGKDLQEQLLIQLRQFPLRGDGQQLSGHVHQRSQVTLSVITQCRDELGAHELRRARALQCVQ